MKDVLSKIIANSRWTYPAFGGKIIIEGRILSPAESEVCGLSSVLIAKSVINEGQLQRLQEIKDDTLEPKEENFESIFSILKDFKADKILQLAESQDKILQKCITRASTNNGETWEQFKLVSQESQQSISRNWLWIGLLEDNDRKEMIQLCLEGHKKASEAIRGSL